MTCHVLGPVRTLSAADIDTQWDGLAALLHACVHAGASIGFVLPFSLDDSAAFWRGDVWPAVVSGHRVLLTVYDGGRLVGSVQLDTLTPPNQPHRAEVRKLMVQPNWRRRGLGRILMIALEEYAGRLGRRLITLDTRTGDAAEPLYASLGYQTVGIIPEYARDPYGTERWDATTIMYKRL